MNKPIVMLLVAGGCLLAPSKYFDAGAAQRTQPLRFAQAPAAPGGVEEDPGDTRATATTAKPTVVVTPAPRPSLTDAWKQIRTYQFGQSRAAIDVLEDEFRTGADKPAERAGWSKNLIALLQPDTSLEAKRWGARWLQVFGTADAVPVLAPFLRDAQLTNYARFALQSLEFPSAAAALRDALSVTNGAVQIGIIQSVGEKGDAAAVPELAKIANGPDNAAASAAVWSLSKIGNAEALQALSSARNSTNAAVKNAAIAATLDAADNAFRTGRANEATPLYSAVLASNVAPNLKSAALRGALLSQPNQAPALLQSTLNGTDRVTRSAALTLIPALLRTSARGPVVELWGSTTAANQAALWDAIAADRPVAADAELQAALQKQALLAIDHSDPRLRLSATKALANWGDASAITPLVRLAATGDNSLKTAAQNSLDRLRGADIDNTLTSQLASANAAAKGVLLQSLANRRAPTALPTLIRTATDADANVRLASLNAIGSVATVQDVATVLPLLENARDEKERAAIEKSLSNVYNRQDVSARTNDGSASVVAALARATGDNKAALRSSLIRVLGAASDSAALAAVRGTLADTNVDVRETSVRALGNWGDGAALPDLQKLAQNAEKPAWQILALRGYIRLTGASSLKVPEKVAQLQNAMKWAQRPDEKRMVLAEAGKIQNPDALRFVRPFLDDATMKSEAAAAIVTIMGNNYKATADKTIEKETLNKILASNPGESQRKAVNERIAKFGR